MIPDRVLIWCHSFWRNDFFQPLLGLLPGVILFSSMRREKDGTKNAFIFYLLLHDAAVPWLTPHFINRWPSSKH
jgi:hypothetical protein